MILLALSLGVGSLLAASSGERRAFEAAAAPFSAESWDYAATNFAKFRQDYPDSPRIPEAILYQGEALFHLRDFHGAIALLTANLSQAANWGDQYLYWIGQAQFGNTNYAAAAEAFGRLLKEFPGSAKRLESCVREAEALANLKEWSRLVQLLQQPNGAFQLAARAGATNAFMGYGYLQLGQAQLALEDMKGVANTLELLSKQPLRPRLDWQRSFLQCQLDLAEDRLEEALDNTTNLVALAGVVNDPPLRARSYVYQAEILERLKRFDDAIDAYRHNLSTNAPVGQQGRAMLKIADLSLAQDNVTNALKTLEDYWQQYPHSGAADVALLTLGELQLRLCIPNPTNGAAAPSAPMKGTDTNLLAQALGRFDLLLNTFTNSPSRGKALLDRGWCYWIQGQSAESTEASRTNYARSKAAFRSAAYELSPSKDQAVARFKWADAQFVLGDFRGAITNYEFVVTHYASDAGIKDQLFEQALYQTVRAALATNDLAAATNALAKILDWYPDGFAGDHCLLLVGQGFARQHDPAAAQRIFQDFEARYPNSELLPKVRLAIARTYEQQGKWGTAINEYTDWIQRYSGDEERPDAEFGRAWDYYMSGQGTNALAMFSEFLTNFPSNNLAPRAQYWIGDYYFRQGNYPKAELNYQLVFKNTNWPTSKLSCRAQMMAGRSAVARISYDNAITFYFAPLANNTNCPEELRLRAYFAWADSLVSRDSTNKTADLTEAIGIFAQIAATTNQFDVPALGRIADCYFQLAATNSQHYAEASNYYWQVFSHPGASVAARSEAKVGLGAVAEGLAQLKQGEEETNLLEQALFDYQDVLYKTDLRPGEEPDPYWIGRAGLETGRLAETLGEWKVAQNVYSRLKDWLPLLSAMLDNKIARLQERINNPPPSGGRAE